MKHWRKIVIFTMVLALPISMWASATMASHCQSFDDTSHAMHMNNDDMHEHMHDHMQLQEEDSNEHSNCDCGCNGSLDCSNSGCSASLISNTMKFDLRNLSKSSFQPIRLRAEPSNPNQLFRPPIIST